MGNTSLEGFSEGHFLAENYSLENATTRILQSKFFSPTFNTAIFDGPLRVYFSQAQEPEALKVYFSLQSKVFQEKSGQEKSDQEQQAEKPLEQLDESVSHIRDSLPKNSTLFVMIYPNKESFQQSFDQDRDFAVAKMEQDCVIGVQGPISDKTRDDIIDYVKQSFKK
ncbi:MAG: hypothetical protein V4596_02100 [Bdellovibrionota bacterium]